METSHLLLKNHEQPPSQDCRLWFSTEPCRSRHTALIRTPILPSQALTSHKPPPWCLGFPLLPLVLHPPLHDYDPTQPPPPTHTHTHTHDFLPILLGSIPITSFLPLFIGSQSSQPTTPLQLLPHNFLDQHNQLLSRVMLVILYLSPIGSLSWVWGPIGTDGSFCPRGEPTGTDSQSSIVLLFPI
jgi:hypothetical protein